MNNLNLVKLLKGCEGTPIWSDIHGQCHLEKIEDSIFPIVLKNNDLTKSYFMNDGRTANYADGKCMIWPSKDCRDWSNFKKLQEIKDGDWVICYMVYPWFYIRKYKCNGMCYSPSINDGISWPYIIPLKDFDPDLSKEDLKELSVV